MRSPQRLDASIPASQALDLRVGIAKLGSGGGVEATDIRSDDPVCRLLARFDVSIENTADKALTGTRSTVNIH
jgi:hypothetical protein